MVKGKVVLAMVIGLFCLTFVAGVDSGGSRRDQIGSRGSRGRMHFQEGGSGSNI